MAKVQQLPDRYRVFGDVLGLQRVDVQQQAARPVLLLGAGVCAAQAQELTPKEQLGKELFFDKISQPASSQACATCHLPAAGTTLAEFRPRNVNGTNSDRMPMLRTTAKCRCGPLEKPVFPEWRISLPIPARNSSVSSLL